MPAVNRDDATAQSSRVRVVRAGTAPVRELREGRGRAERLAPPGDDPGWFVVSRVTIDPLTAEGPFHRHHRAENVYLVLEGTLRVRAGRRLHELGAGEAIFIPAGQPHATHNPAGRPVTLLAIYDRSVDDDFETVMRRR